ncbi:MAG: hypothetical protein ACI89L_000954 [Phycisphaerales bacterium]|jgi:hypothetical protein
MRWADRNTHRRNSHHQLVAIAGLTVLVLAGSVAGQTLDLSVPEPVPGATVVHRAIADELKEAAAVLRMNAPDRDDSPEAAMRELASALLERGLRRTSDGAALLVAGHTLAQNLPRIDATLAALSPVDRVTIAADSARLASTLSSEPEDVDRSLRDVLAPLTHAVRPSPQAGWLGLDAPSPDSATLTARVDRPPVSTAPGLLRLIDEARTDPAFAPSADRLARRLDAAAAVLDLPDTISPDARDALGARYAEAVRQCLGGNAIEGAQTLDNLAELGRLLTTIEELPDDADTELARAHAESMTLGSDPIPTDRVRLGLRLAQAATAPEPDPMSKSFVRDLRPAWAVLRADAKTTKAELRPLLPSALRASMDSDPGLLAALGAVRRVDTRLRDLHALNTWLKGELGPDSPPVAHRDHRPLSERAGRLLRESPASLWQLADQSRRFVSLPAESVWRDPATLRDGWIRNIDALLPEIAGAADRLREQWEDSWAAGGAGGDDAAELNAGVRLLSILDAIGTAQNADQTGWRLAAWTGWEHAADLSLAPTLVGDTASLAVLVAAWTDPLTPIDETTLAEAEHRFAAVRAVAALENRLRAAGRSPVQPSLPVALAQLGLGTPDAKADPLAANRSQIAELNRRVLEAAAFVADDQWREPSLDYANDAAMKLLQRLKRDED